MGALDRFLGKPKEVEIEGEKFLLKPIKVKDLMKITVNNPTPEQSLKIAKTLITLSLNDVTEEEIDELPLDIYMKLINEINKLNGFEDEQSDRVRELLKQRQTGK